LYGGFLFAAMLIIGLGLGTMQSASLVMAFASVSSPSRASVAWNMNFDARLAVAGVLGGIGFTYLGASSTLLLCALRLLLAGALSWISRTLDLRRAGRSWRDQRRVLAEGSRCRVRLPRRPRARSLRASGMRTAAT